MVRNYSQLTGDVAYAVTETYRMRDEPLLARLEVRNFFLVCAAYLTLVTGHVLVEVYNDCTLYYDVGIYAEGMRKLSLHDFNPWLGARAVYLFADHFDPIVWLAAPLAKLGPAPYGAVVAEALFMLASVIPLFAAAAHGYLAQRTTLLLAVLTLFNAGAMTAVHYPLHPTTWAMAPMVATSLALHRGRPTLAILAFVVLLTCKEEFPFVGLPLAWLLWRAGARRHAAAALVVAALWSMCVFGLRPLLIGPTEAYWSQPFVGLLRQPWAYFRGRLSAPDMPERLCLFALPLLPLTFWLASAHRRFVSGAYLALAAPPMALRFLAMRWRHQYHAVTMGAVTLAFVPALGRREVPRWLVGITVVALFAVNYRIVTNAYGLARTGVEAQYPYCPMDRQRAASLERARNVLRADPRARMLVGQNLLPKLVDLPNARLPAEFPHPPTAPYRWVLLEKPPLGASWPLNDARIGSIIARCRAQPGTEVFIDDAGLFFARGAFLD